MKPGPKKRGRTVKHTIAFPEQIEEMVRVMRAEFIIRRIGDGSLSDVANRLIAAGHRHREEIFDRQGE